MAPAACFHTYTQQKNRHKRWQLSLPRESACMGKPCRWLKLERSGSISLFTARCGSHRPRQPCGGSDERRRHGQARLLACCAPGARWQGTGTWLKRSRHKAPPATPPTTAAAARWHRRRLPTLCYFMCSPVPRLAGAPLGSRPAPWSSCAWPLAALMPSHTSTRASSACPSSSRATSTWCGRAGGEARSSWRLPGSSVGHPEGQCSLFARRAAAQPRNALPTVDSLVVGFQLGPAGHSRL